MLFNMLTSSRKNLGMVEIVPQWKIGPGLLCGRMYVVLKNLFLNSKLDLFLVLKANFYSDWPRRTQVITISLDMENSKWQISEKKALNLRKFQKSIFREPFRVRWKSFAHFWFLVVGTFEQNLIKIWDDGWQNWKFCPSLM